MNRGFRAGGHFRSIETATVHQHEHGAGTLAQPPAEILVCPRCDDREAGDGLRARRIVVEHDDLASRVLHRRGHDLDLSMALGRQLRQDMVLENRSRGQRVPTE